MPEHVHEWEVRWRADGPEWVCATNKKLSRFDDDHVLSLEEITRRLNATERLNAQRVREIVSAIRQGHNDGGWGPVDFVLSAYASALEGE